MPTVSIDNPMLNSPFEESARHFTFDEHGITGQVAEGRRRSTYFVPLARPRARGGGQLSLPGDWVAEGMTDNDFINPIREQVTARRTSGRGVRLHRGLQGLDSDV